MVSTETPSSSRPPVPARSETACHAPTFPHVTDPQVNNAGALGLTPYGGHLTGGIAGLTGRMTVRRTSVVHGLAVGRRCPPRTLHIGLALSRLRRRKKLLGARHRRYRRRCCASNHDAFRRRSHGAPPGHLRAAGAEGRRSGRVRAGKSRLDRNRVRAGVPHPSGTNAERIAFFLGRKPRQALSPNVQPERLIAARTESEAKNFSASLERNLEKVLAHDDLPLEVLLHGGCPHLGGDGGVIAGHEVRQHERLHLGSLRDPAHVLGKGMAVL